MNNRIKVLNKFIVGSTVFFNVFDDFKSKDTDEIWIVEDSKIFKNGDLKSFLIHAKDKDIVLYKPLLRQQFIELDLKTKDSIKLGKYLVKSFIDYIGLTINDLESLKLLYDNLDSKHKYQKIIYDAYLENNEFILTEKQLEDAYNAYKSERINK